MKTYTRPGVPVQYDPKWIGTQLANIERTLARTSRTITGDATMDVSDDRQIIYADPATGSITYTLLAPTAVQNIVVTVVQISAGTVTIGGTVSGVSNPTVGGQYKVMVISCNGIAFFKIGAV